MKLLIKTFALSAILVVLFSILPNIANAQLGDPGDDPDAPIDGGVSVLVAAGIGYGVKKMRDNKKKNESALK
jgi:hypothetical protein